MKEYGSLFYIPMCIAYMYWSVQWGRKGYRYFRSQTQYKPWLPANDSLNWKYGLNLLLISIAIGLMGSTFFFNILLEIFWDMQVFLELVCLGFPILLICGINLYNLNQNINHLKPRSNSLEK